VSYLVVRHELDSVDEIARSRPDMVDEVVRAYAECGAWTDPSIRYSRFPLTQVWRVYEPYDLEPLCHRLIHLVPWLARRGHPVTAIGGACMNSCVNVCPSPSMAPADIAAALHLVRPSPIPPDSLERWRRDLFLLSERGCASLALSLAKIVGLESAAL
jgi:hypothetical protein